MKILLATDGSECSVAAVDEVARGPWPRGSEIRVVSVVEIPVAIAPESWILPPGYYDEIESAVTERARAAVDTAAARLSKALGDRAVVTAELLAGNPRMAIVEAAGQWGADLVVVGSHGYRGFERFLLGSVSQAVSQRAPCSVEIVKCRHAPDA